jgi:putative endonuclease
MKQYIYILRCSGQKLYTGYTNNIEKRIKSHIKGNITSKFTRAFKPLRIEVCWILDGNKSAALKTEASIKKLSRSKKEELFKNTELIINHTPENIPIEIDVEWSGKNLKF